MYYLVLAVCFLNTVMLILLARHVFSFIERHEMKEEIFRAGLDQTSRKAKAASDAARALKDMFEKDQELRKEQDEKRSRQEEMFFSGVNNILNYDMSIARKAAMDSDAEE